MARPVIMPALEMAQETGTVVKWLKQPGDSVEKGEPILEIETDKVTVEVEAPESGILRDVTAEEGDEIPVGETIAMVYAPGEEVVPKQAAPASAPAAAPVAEPARPAPPSITPAPARAPAAAGAARLPAASPKARRLAAERAVDLSSLSGSGPGGAILAADLPEEEGARGVSSRWRVMAERMSSSWTSAPHFYLAREVRARALASWLERARREAEARVTYTDLLVKLVATSLERHPAVNVSWQRGAIVSHDAVDIGLAVAVEDGLLVPVIRGADGLSLDRLAAQREDLVARAEAGDLRPADIRGGTFTISNLGMYGVDAFSAIVNPPNAAILAVGRIADRVLAVDGRVVVEPTLVLTLSCDHRALDGARAARFLSTLAELIEQPPA